MSNYYHVCFQLLEEGSVILPGNWGRCVNLYDRRAIEYNRESAFENVRLQHYPQLPSRLKSIFLFDDLSLAVKFRDQTRKLENIYQVKILDNQKISFRTDMRIVPVGTELQAPDIFIRLPQLAHNYWNPINIAAPEILIESRVQIIKLIS